MNTKLGQNIYWVGKNDDREVPFHRLTLTKGTTYNSYLIKSDLPTIIDTVDFYFAKEYIENLAKEIDLLSIKYIVINHTEPDHSGGLRALAGKAKNAIIVCSEKAVYELKEMYKLHEREFLVVSDKDTLDIGGQTLEFYETPYLHTEETMVTYLKEDKILFPCDIFSTHVATQDMFNDKHDIQLDFETYYSLIMHPHRFYVQDMIKKIAHLDIQMIAPSHGFILRENVSSYIETYDRLSKEFNKDKKGVILYSTITRNTQRIAEEIQNRFSSQSIELELVDVNRVTSDQIDQKILDADVIFVGTSTKYADMVGKLEEVLIRMKDMDLKGKIGIGFGSYGWSGEAIEVVQDYLLETNLTTLETSNIIKSTGMTDVKFPIRVRFSLNDENRQAFDRGLDYAMELVTQ